MFKKSPWDTNILIVGMGEVGRPIFEIIEENSEFSVYGYDLDRKKCSDNFLKIPNKVDILHICIPCILMDDFIKTVTQYYELYKTELLIINSTIPPLTTQFLAEELPRKVFIVHSPIFGTHESKEAMKIQIKNYVHLVGGINKESAMIAYRYFKDIGLKYIKVMRSPLESEIMKIMETTYAGWMITFFSEFHRLCEEVDADFVEIVEALVETYEPNCNKPIWHPDVIGGHCIMQNIDLLLQVYDSGFLHLIKESNELRKEEVKDERIKRIIDVIKRLKKP